LRSLLELQGRASASATHARLARPMLPAVTAALGLFDQKNKALFVHVPKNGGTAVEVAIKKAHLSSFNPCGGEGSSINEQLCGDLIEDCKRYDEAIGFKSRVTSLPMVEPLWGNVAHHTDSMARCALALHYPSEWVNISFALISDPLRRAVSSWDWMHEHEPEHMREMNFTFASFVSSQHGMARDVFGVQQCAFISTKSGINACENPTNEEDRVTKLFAYTPKLETNHAFVEFLNEYYPSIQLEHVNGEMSADPSSHVAVTHSHEIIREGDQVDVVGKAREYVLDYYAEDVLLYRSLLGVQTNAEAADVAAASKYLRLSQSKARQAYQATSLHAASTGHAATPSHATATTLMASRGALQPA